MAIQKQQIETLQKMIDESQNIVFFGGAGTSTDCGLPDFRGTEGLYTEGGKKKTYKYSPEYMLHCDFMHMHPREFFDFYRNEMIFDYAKPNSFHEKLVKLEQNGKLKAIITQNIDSLHQKAGSKRVLELHGSSARNYCIGCGETYSEQWMKHTTEVPKCEKCGKIVRPDVTLYGEALKQEVFLEAEQAIAQADMIIVAGTSLAVYPAAGLVRSGHFSGKYLVIINKQETEQDRFADLVINDSVTEVFDALYV
ncbi:MAG: NAD-dependent protein deacylase [Lachnospiraceae bacterium]|nr:NAD-dependent protein deacylase [Lachnospiraceae bacterium]